MKAFEPISRYFLSPIAEDQEVRFGATPKPAHETRTLPRFPRNSPLVSQANQSPVTDNCLQLTRHRPLIGRGGGVGRPLGVTPGLGVSVGLAVGVAVTV